jgi:hypothetical protein
MSIVVYSVNTGGYDELKNPTVINPNVRYILFTDNKYFKSNVWEVCHIDFLSHLKDSRRIARYVKINSHLVLPPHEYSVWVDHCFTTKIDNFTKIIEETPHNEILCYKHDQRRCIYDESIKVLEDKLDYPHLVNEQMERYRKEGFPKNQGLFSTGFIIRKKSDKVKIFNETWWNEIVKGSARDQLSQVYSSWKTNTNITGFKYGLNIYDNPYLFPKVKHPKKWLI